MIDYGSLAEKGIDISRLQSHKEVAFNMGKNSVKQKSLSIGINDGPKCMEDVIHLYNFEKIRDRTEIPGLVEQVRNGAEEKGYTDGMIFLNCEEE